MSASPVLLACVGAVLLCGLPVIAASSLLEGDRRAAGVADAASLAAADALAGWIEEEPCVSATRVADAAGARLVECELDESRAEARVSVEVETSLGTVRAQARAGPPLE